MLGPFVDSWQWIKSHNPGSPFKKRHLNFITIHYLYILSLAIIGSILIYPAGNLDYIDALFFGSGCATQSGLNTVDINTLNTYQQVVFYFLAMIATPIFINTFVVFVRLYWFERRFQHVVREARRLRHTRSRSRTKTELEDNQDSSRHEKGVRGRSIVVLHKNEAADSVDDATIAASLKKLDESEPTSTSASSQEDKSAPIEQSNEEALDQPPSLRREVTFADEVEEVDAVGELKPPPTRAPHRRSEEEHIAFLENQRNPKDKRTLRIPGPREFDRGDVPETVAEDEDGGALSHRVTSPIEDSTIASGGPIKRNITIDEPKHPRQRTGTGLSKISVPSQRSNQFTTEKTTSPEGDDSDKPPQSARLRTRTGTFSSLRHWGSREPEPVTPYLSWQPTIGRNSAFVDLTEEQREELGGIEYRSLKTLAIVLAVPRESGVWEELKFLLDHPRRCFTLLFPTDATSWLFWILVFLNGLDIIFFIILDLHDPVVTGIGNVGYRILNGMFQASSTRTAGFSTVNLANLHPGIQVSYMVMMYISVFPIAISVRRTNVYEEKSLGIYTSASEDEDAANEPSYVGAHLRKQLSFDLWYIFLGLFIIAVAEGDRLQNTNDYAFNIYSCLFEIVSAYGTVGLSLGYPNVNASFSSQFSVVSKLVIIAMQIRGRHRGLPYELDRAILLPSESLHKKEDADAARRVQRRNSSLSNIEPIGSGLGKPSTMPRTPTQGTSTGREQAHHPTMDSFVGEHGHSGRAGAAIGKMMAGFAAGPRLERREKSGHTQHDD
ncbi:MAG: hypothetical protein Q9222_000332 [Ikaeria aurantiellina]